MVQEKLNGKNIFIMGKEKTRLTERAFFQKWSKRAKEVAKSKEEQLQVAHAERQARVAASDEERAAAVERAKVAAALKRRLKK